MRPAGAPHTAATWYDWEDGRVLLNMDESRLRLDYLRANPAVALTVLAADDWYRQVTLLGRVVSIEEDDGCATSTGSLRSYTPSRYRNRETRRFNAWMEPERWYSWPPPR